MCVDNENHLSSSNPIHKCLIKASNRQWSIWHRRFSSCHERMVVWWAALNLIPVIISGRSLAISTIPAVMEDDFNPSSLSGLGLDTILADLQLPSSASLGNQLGLSGLDSLTSNQIFSGFPEDGAIGVGQGDDFEDEVDREIKKEVDDSDGADDEGGGDGDVKMEGIPTPPRMAHSPTSMDEDDDLFGPEPPRKRPRRGEPKRTKRAAAPSRPVNVHELFPSFEPGKILNFTELFKGRSLKKSKVKHRSLNGGLIFEVSSY